MDLKSKELGNYVSTKLLTRLKEIAKNAKKVPDREKIFSKPSDAETIENFYQLLLECLFEW
jgi:hypothetical protein